MKFKNYYLIASLIMLLISSNICIAQANTNKNAKLEIVAKSTFLPYKTVKDNYGKKFAQSYFVIQVDIRNEKFDQQFIVQTLDVILNPNQCSLGKELYAKFDVAKCEKIFDDYFVFPNVQQSIRREEVIGTGKADLNRSNRNIGFRILAFSAAMGSILTGFDGVLGPDGVKGINVLGTTVTAAANGLFPNTADEKLENLKNALPTEDVIIKSNESKTFNIFIPTERVFWKDSWERYTRPTKNTDKDTYSLKVILDLLLISSATGVLVDNNAEKVVVRSDDSLRRQTQNFAKITAFSEGETKTTDDFFETMVRLKANLDNPDTNNNATGLLRNIVIDLQKESRFKTFLEGKVDSTSKGEDIFPVIQLLSEDLETVNRDPALIAKFQNIIIKSGK